MGFASAAWGSAHAATTTTDADGNFTLSDVKVGSYMVVAAAKHEGHGRARVSVASSQTSSVDIVVTQGAGGGHGGGHGGGKLNK